MIDFPVTTTVGQAFVAAGSSYTWNGQGWIVTPPTALLSATAIAERLAQLEVKAGIKK
jgi:hypothetical protein